MMDDKLTLQKIQSYYDYQDLYESGCIILLRIKQYYISLECPKTQRGRAKIISELLHIPLTRVFKKRELSEFNPYITGFESCLFKNYERILKEMGYMIITI